MWLELVRSNLENGKTADDFEEFFFWMVKEKLIFHVTWQIDQKTPNQQTCR